MILFNMKRALPQNRSHRKTYVIVFINVYHRFPMWHVKCSMIVKRAEEIRDSGDESDGTQADEVFSMGSGLKDNQL
jgi:hypothetical protein